MLAQRRVGEALLEDLLLLGKVLLVADAEQVAWSVNLVRVGLSDLFELAVDVWRPVRLHVAVIVPGRKAVTIESGR